MPVISRSLSAGVLLAAGIWAPAQAADAPKCRDLPDLARFAGSTIAMCVNKNFGELTIPASPITEFDFDKKIPTLTAHRDVEGKITQNVYLAPVGASAAEVFRNYLSELEAKGYQLVYQGKKSDLGPHMGSYFGYVGPGGQVLQYSADEARYVAAVKNDGGRTVTLGLYVVEFGGNGYTQHLDPQKDQVLVRLDAVESGQLANKMVVATAAEIGDKIQSTGKIALYGINFDFNKAEIRPESRPAIDEIAKYLTANPDRKIYIIGHTDNVGGLDFNMRLSKSRAEAVAAELARTYGVSPARLTPTGVGLLAPVASNDNEEGRAKNRRVELVPR